MDRVFLDANVLFSAAYRPDNGLLRLWRLPTVELITSGYAIDEAARNLSTDVELEQLSELMSKISIVDAPPDTILPQGITLPDKDAPILRAAIVAGSTHLLTGDKQHFGPIYGQTVNGVLIQPPSEYLGSRQEIQQGDEDQSSH